MAEQAGKVYLVGSGPGDAAYLTVQAQEILAQAEVLIYDALVDGALVDLVPESCLKLDVGKRGGQPSTAQSDINRLLVEHCQQGKQVVRLKNGDPFVFGRAQSEIGALKRANCEFEVVPGLSSALVAPLLAGIPLTDPQLSQNFTVITAHNPDGLNWVALSKLDTLVFLMGGQTLSEIVRRLRGHGRSPYTPIAVIRYAGRTQQQVWEGSLNNILDKTAGEALSPCVIVVGEVVKLRAYINDQRQPRRQTMPDSQPERRDRLTEVADREAFDDRPRRKRRPPEMLDSARDISPDEIAVPMSNDHPPVPPPPRHLDPLPPKPDSQFLEAEPTSTEPLPLSGKTVLVTRAASQSSQFTTLLEEQGAAVIEMPTLEIVPPSSWRDLDRAIARLDDFDWLILTSTNGVDYFFQRLEAVTGERTFSTNIKIAVVGEKTAQRLARMGIQPDFIPPNFVADSLVATFPEPLGGLRVLFPRVESGGREVLVKEFTSQGAKVREVAAYESRCPDEIAPQALRALQTRSIDIVTFASSKTVQHFCQLLQQTSDEWPTWIEAVCIASIGPQTSKSCQTLLGRVDVEAIEYTLEGLTQALVDWATPPEPPAPEADSASLTGVSSSENTLLDSKEDSALEAAIEPVFESISEVTTEATVEVASDEPEKEPPIIEPQNPKLSNPLESDRVESGVIEVDDFTVLESTEQQLADLIADSEKSLTDNSPDGQGTLDEMPSLTMLPDRSLSANPTEDGQSIPDLQAVLAPEESLEVTELQTPDPWEDNAGVD